jgi:hypothetical protein
MISVVVWLWRDGSRDYRPEHVNVLARMIRRHLSLAHEFVCVTDSAAGLDPSAVVWFPTPREAAEIGRLRSPEGVRFPSCYRRLWMFSQGAREIGDRLMLLDIDLIALRELAPLFDRRADFVGWCPRMIWGSGLRYGGGIYLLTPGTRSAVWDRFVGVASIAEARRAGFRGSDQAWLSYVLGPRQDSWPSDAGIYSIRDMKNGRAPLPSDARLVQFNGPQKPWTTPLAWARAEWQ